MKMKEKKIPSLYKFHYTAVQGRGKGVGIPLNSAVFDIFKKSPPGRVHRTRILLPHLRLV
jgi:hypothetical protein